MDWAEELKMSIRKTTARKGRRAKNRDTSKDNSFDTKHNSSGTGTSSSNQGMSIDISLDVQQQQQSGNSIHLSSAGQDLKETSGEWNTTFSTGSTSQENSSKLPHMLRRISGGWADATFSKSSKSKKDSSQIPELDTRTVSSTGTAISSSKESIPIIPDLDEFSDEYFNKDFCKKISISTARLSALQEINEQLQEQDALCSTVPDVDLSILIKNLQPKDTLNEPDEVWEWDKIFIELVAEINGEKTVRTNSEERKSVLGPDELPPTNSTTRIATKNTLEKN